MVSLLSLSAWFHALNCASDHCSRNLCLGFFLLSVRDRSVCVRVFLVSRLSGTEACVSLKQKIKNDIYFYLTGFSWDSHRIFVRKDLCLLAI